MFNFFKKIRDFKKTSYQSIWIATILFGLISISFYFALLLPTLTDIENGVVSVHLGIARNGKNNIEGFIDENVNALNDLAQILGVSKEKEIIIDRFLKERKVFAEISLINNQGQEILKRSRFLVYAVEDLKNISWSESFIKPMEREIYLSPVYASEKSVPYLTVSLPIKSSPDQISGVLSAELSLREIWDIVSKIKVGASGQVYLVDSRGYLSAHPNTSLVLKKTNVFKRKAVEKVVIEKQIIDGLDKNDEYFNEIGERVYVAGLPLSEMGWGIFVEEPVKDTWASYRRIRDLGRISILAGIFPFLILFFGVRALTKTLQDLKESKTALEVKTRELEEAKTKSELLLASIGDGVFAVDRENNIIHFNRQAENISGYKAHEVLGKPYYDSLKFLKEKDRSENIDFIRTALKGKTMDMANHTVLVRKNKREVPVVDSAAPIKNEKGEVLGVIVVFRDAEKERQIENMRAEMISLVGHQLKAPLTTIKWRAEILKKGKLDTEERAHVEEIEQVVKFMTGLVINVLDISKIEQGRIKLKLQPTRFEEIVDSILKDLSPLAKERKVDIGFKKPAKTLFQVNVDPKYIKEAIQNIISNAINYTKDKVTISCEKAGNKLRFTCIDNGIGIPQEEQSKIFQKFYRASNVAKTGIEGTGLGLSIAKAIIKKSGGQTWFTSPALPAKRGKKEGKGTTFYVSLPFI